MLLRGVEVKPAMLINAGISIKKLQLLLILEFLIYIYLVGEVNLGTVSGCSGWFWNDLHKVHKGHLWNAELTDLFSSFGLVGL